MKRRPSRHSDVTTATHASPFGAPQPAEWSQSALAVASIVMTFIEPDPTAGFSDQRIAAVRDTLLSAE